MDFKFDFQEDYVVKEIIKKKCKKVLLQLPEGLKMEGSRLANYFENKTSAEIVVSGEPCWGACDLALDEAKKLEVDILIHYGHAPFIKRVDFPVLYVEMNDLRSIDKLLNLSLKTLNKYNSLGLVCSVQHKHQLEQAKKFFEDHGKKVIIPEKKGYAHYDGHVVGCEYNSLKTITNEVDAFVVIGNRFHSLGAAIAVENPVYLLDIYNNEIIEMSKYKDKIIKQRYAAIEKCKDAKKVGIIVGTKPGQKFGSFKVIKDKFRKLGKEVIVITMNEINSDKLTNFRDINCFVELACPRIAIEDYGRYDKTLITFRESLVVLGDMSWEDLLKNGLI
ncbi:diphthamide biosynthesis enzyme Dph2 [Candidatus Woesearchaeota archaeon]|nr:diphthamide biosynthesis enzyme Dph2 [Candidatus Woesearchaeota archaeon]